MNLNTIRPFLTVFLALSALTARAQSSEGVQVWLTNPDKSALFERQKASLTFGKATNPSPAIVVDEKRTYQSIDGFGYALTGGSAQHLIRMAPERRAALLKELFAEGGTNLGVSYIRLTIGASDLNDHVFSYDDLPAGEADLAMDKFTLEEDQKDVIPVTKEILQLNPALKILACPWSAPAWMKDNGKVKGGQLKPECYAAYAKYFVKYIQGMEKMGVRIDAITPQNEPLNPLNTPSMVMPAEAELSFIRDHLGPAFKAAGIKTRIILYDHNCDVPQYALTILSDPEAAKYVDGSGFHLYGGDIRAMTQVHDAHPDKNLYFTEQMVTGSVESEPNIRLAAVPRLIIGATRNWSRNVVLWNLAADPNNKPHTDDGGCGMCQGAVTIDGSNYSRNVAYYVVGHASKFVRPGSVRIDSNEPETLPNVAFKTPDGRKVLIVFNGSRAPQTFNITSNGETAQAVLNARAVATYVW